MKNLLLCVVIVWSFAISSEEYEVKMLNFGNDGSMVFEPGFLKVNVGDTVHFKSVDMAHNSESSTGLIPVNASGWKGNIKVGVSSTFNRWPFQRRLTPRAKKSPHRLVLMQDRPDAVNTWFGCLTLSRVSGHDANEPHTKPEDG